MMLAVLLAASVLLNEGWLSELTPEGGAPKRIERVNLPHCWDDYHGCRGLFHGELHGSATYTRSFNAALKVGERGFLVFEGVGTFLTVRVNGVELCKRRAAAKIVTTIEATAALRQGENRLEVICDHPSECQEIVWACGGCCEFDCESPEPIGLFRDVRFVTTGPARIAPFGVHLWSDDACETALVETELDFGKCAAGDLRLRVRCDELKIDRTVDASAAKGGFIKCAFPLKAVTRWSLENPKLYDFEVTLLNNRGEVYDRVVERTGYRSIRWPFCGEKDPRFFLNGKPTFIHGTCETDHRFGGSHAFEPEEIAARVNEFKKLGFNMVREGHEPHDLRFHHGLEAAGIMYYAGFSTGSYFDNDAFRSNLFIFVEQWVKERRNSPALMLWDIQNESRIPIEIVRECVKLIRKLDPMSGPKGRLVMTCNYGGGADWNVVQNWSGTYDTGGHDLMAYGEDLQKPEQLLNGEYGGWRVVGWHSDPDAKFEKTGDWTEEHMSRICYEKIMRAWLAREKVCGHFIWTFFSHQNPGRPVRVDDGYREIDKIGPTNNKGVYSLWGHRTVAWYLYYAYGQHLQAGDLGKYVNKPHSWWLAEGRRLAEPKTLPMVTPRNLLGKTCIARLNCGGDEVVDSMGNRWMADSTAVTRSWAQDADLQITNYWLNPVLGSQDVVEGEIKNVDKRDQELFRTFRYGRKRLSFTFDAPPLAECTLEMYLVEPGSYGRAFDIAVNGVTIERGLELGKMPERNVIRRVWQVTASKEGKIVISFPRVAANQAVVSAIALWTNPSATVNWSRPKRAVGYPKSDGLTWGELGARVRHTTPRSTLPDGGVNKKPFAASARAYSGEDFEGYHRSWFLLHNAGDYSVVLKVLKGGNPVGKKVSWILANRLYENPFAKGEWTIDKVEADGMVVVPLKTFLNAGLYGISLKCEDDCVSIREMRY